MQDFDTLICQAKPLLRKNDMGELVDPSLGKNYNVRQLNLVLLAASLCVQQSSIRRPSMSQASHSKPSCRDSTLDGLTTWNTCMLIRDGLADRLTGLLC